ncbi:adaptin protein [Natrialba sp. INN-245]|uniref:adaptin protein n=1 Tax=Natrialba sp. INN-245 TaxID=2690967 RepID=UPI0013138851|nr:adaptin protein [Natrialba sp. INN-245]MWV40568.1 adaptin protein [Natrialba sp. INN-245]
MTSDSPTQSNGTDRTDPVPTTVICFDRDHTVSVNPHPDRDAVPLSWIKYLAHEVPDIDVWATGNQTLREEASIPGISEAITCWRYLTLPENPMKFHSHVPVGARLPGRREGLHLIQAVYGQLATASETYQLIVVDDVDLSDLESDGWAHYFPEEFVDAVEADTAGLDLPVPLENPSNIPLTDPDCPDTYPPLDFDQPGPLQYR